MLRNLMVIALLMASAATARSQTYFLSVDSVVGIPDTIVNGQVVPFTMYLTNQGNLVYQGGLDVVLEFPGTQDSLVADSAFLGNNFLAAQAQTEVYVSHQFNAGANDAMVIGDNVVVVWPKIHNGPTVPEQEVVKVFTTSFYLIEPLSVRDDGHLTARPLTLFPNPADDVVRLSVPASETVARVEVTDLSGRTALETHGTGPLSVRDLPKGFYCVTVRCLSGAVYRGRLAVR
jgi:hypothetical protein